MPIARIQMPDGRIARFEVPEGKTPQQIEAFAKAQLLDEQAAAISPLDGMSTAQKALAGYGAAIPNVVAGAKQRLGMVDQKEIDARKRQQAPLMKDPAGLAGNIAGNLVAFSPTAAIPGANTVTGSAVLGGIYGALQPTAEGESALLNTALGAAGGAAGQYGAGKVAQGLAGRKAAKESARIANQVRDKTMKAGQQAGYVVSPANANPTAWNRLLQGLAGKTASGQRAAMMNQKTTNQLARQAIGLPEDAPLTPETFEAVRASAGQAYEALKNYGRPFVRDASYDKAVANVFDSYRKMASQVDGMALSGMDDLAKTLDSVKQLDPETAVELVKRLRQATTAYGKAAATGQGNPSAKTLESAHRAAATAIEDLIDRNLMQSGDDALLKSLQESRKLIAKAHTLEKALNVGNGNIIASKLGAELQKGRPLSGELKTIGQFAKSFPREVQEVANSSWLQQPGVSPLDWAVAGLTTAGTGNPVAMAIPAVRPLANALLTSAPYQAAMTTPKYAQGAIANALMRGVGSKSGKYLARQGGAMAAN